MNLLKLHFRYLFGKRNIILMAAVFMIAGVSFLLATRPFNSHTDHLINGKSYFQNYFSNCLLLTRIMQVLLLSFVMGMSFTPPCDSYHILYLSYRRMRLPYYLSKLFLLLLVAIFICMLFCFLYFSIGFLSAPWFIFRINQLEAFINLSLLSLYYGLCSSLLVFLIKSPLSSVIAYIIYMTSEFLQSLMVSDVNTYIQLVFPSLIVAPEGFKLAYGPLHVLVLIGLAFLLGSYLYSRFDLT